MQMLYDIGEIIKYIYFPDRALVSLLSLLEDGSITEVGAIGKDSMVGLPVCWGGNSTHIQGDRASSWLCRADESRTA